MNKVLAVRYQGLREENMRLKREVREQEVIQEAMEEQYQKIAESLGNQSINDAQLKNVYHQVYTRTSFTVKQQMKASKDDMTQIKLAMKEYVQERNKEKEAMDKLCKTLQKAIVQSEKASNFEKLFLFMEEELDKL